jgi:anti-sigma regulatory factor (Ser/Thr protein kinase)
MIETATFKRDLRSAKQARRFVIERLHGYDSALVDNVALMTSELVTNAIQYSTGTLMVTLEVDAETLRVGVSDVGPGTPMIRNPRPEEPNGRGLQIVAALANEWGASPNDDGGNTVWFILQLDSQEQREQSHTEIEGNLRPQRSARKSTVSARYQTAPHRGPGRESSPGTADLAGPDFRLARRPSCLRCRINPPVRTQTPVTVGSPFDDRQSATT